jgi:chromate transporter
MSNAVEHLTIETTYVHAEESSKVISLRYLFFTFFKIGLLSFGGHMALISVIQRVMVDKDKIIEDEVIMSSVGVASFLPGPLAVNVVGQVGYHVRGTIGALVSSIAVILPSFLLILLIAWQYFAHQQMQSWQEATRYVVGAVSALIFTTALQLFKKEVQGKSKKMFLFIIAVAILLVFNNYFVTIALLIAGGLAGMLMKIQAPLTQKVVALNEPVDHTSRPAGIHWKHHFNQLLFLILGVNQVLFFSKISRDLNPLNLRIISIFSGISLSLFGGGYVMIPIMESLFVTDLHWLTSKEFVDAIAFSQATPGPILISAAFIGYKIAGIIGALLATVAIFAPSVFLVINVSRFINGYKNNDVLANLLGGIKTVVVALILSSGYRLFSTGHLDVYLVAVLLITFLLNFHFKVSPVYLILGAILFGILKNSLIW